MKAFWLGSLSTIADKATDTFRPWLTITLLALLFPSLSLADEVVMRVYLQAVDYGERIFLLEDQNDVYFTTEDFQDIGFTSPPAKALTKRPGYVSLSDLAPAVSYEIDNNSATLTITSDPGELEGTTLSFGYNGDYPPPAKRLPAAYLNWYFNYGYSDKSSEDSLSMPLEFAYSAGDYAFYTGFIYTKDGDKDGSDQYLRRQTRLTRDEPDKMVRWQAGDTTHSSGRLGGAAVLGGVGVTRSFFMQSGFSPYPGNEISGIATHFSTADIYVNDVFIGRREVMPGEFSAQDLPLITGSGEVRIELIDPLGNIDVIEGAIYASKRVLKDGLHDYGYGLGWIREGLLFESFDYGRPALIGHHRYGITDWFTLGMGLEVMKHRYNVSPNVTLLFGSLGQLDVAIAASLMEDDAVGTGDYDGHAGLGEYNYVNNGFSIYLTGKYQSRRYSTVSLDAVDDEKEKHNFSAGISHNFGPLGTLGTSYSSSTDWNDLDTDKFTLNWSVQLADNLTFNARGQKMEVGDDASTYTVWAGLSGVFGDDHMVSFEHTEEDDIRTQRFKIQKSAPIAKGLGYDVTVSRANGDSYDNEYGSNGTFRYNGNHAKTSTGYRYSKDTLFLNATASGAISFLDGEINFSRPINDSFALVRVGVPEKVRIFSNNNYGGSTGECWNMVVPELVSYSKANISYKPLELPIKYKTKAYTYNYTPSLRSGHIVTFDIETIHAISGYLKLDGEPIEFTKVCIEGGWGEDVDCSMLGQGGEFYFENLPPGEVAIRAETSEGDCFADIQITASEEIIVEIGEVSCEIH